MISAVKRYTLLDYVLSVLALVGISIPIFWVALLLLQIFAFQLDWVPASGMRSVRENFTGVRAWLDIAHHMLLPTAVLSFAQLASWSRYQRSALLDVLRSARRAPKACTNGVSCCYTRCAIRYCR